MPFCPLCNGNADVVEYTVETRDGEDQPTGILATFSCDGCDWSCDVGGSFDPKDRADVMGFADHPNNLCRQCGLTYSAHGVRNSRGLVDPGSRAAAPHRFKTVVGGYSVPNRSNVEVKQHGQ